MTYAVASLKAKSIPNNFGGLRVDANRIGMTDALGNQTYCQDATASPVTSPISNGSGSGLVLTVPQNAVRFIVLSTVACLVGEDSTYTYGFSVPANTIWEFDVADQQYVYLKPSNGTNTINFFFQLV